MYRGKRPFPKKISKSMAKEINRQGKAEIVSGLAEPIPPPRPLQPPLKIARAERELILGSLEKKHAGLKKVSKRTTPGKVEAESPPAHIHMEGTRWAKNLVQQNRVSRQMQTKKSAKAKSKKKI